MPAHIEKEGDNMECKFYEMVDHFEDAVALMDDELREQVIREHDPETEEEFLAFYLELHYKKYGKEFTI